jgi:hypothetical protein
MLSKVKKILFYRQSDCMELTNTIYFMTKYSYSFVNALFCFVNIDNFTRLGVTSIVAIPIKHFRKITQMCGGVSVQSF